MDDNKHEPRSQEETNQSNPLHVENEPINRRDHQHEGPLAHPRVLEHNSDSESSTASEMLWPLKLLNKYTDMTGGMARVGTRTVFLLLWSVGVALLIFAYNDGSYYREPTCNKSTVVVAPSGSQSQPGALCKELNFATYAECQARLKTIKSLSLKYNVSHTVSSDIQDCPKKEYILLLIIYYLIIWLGSAIILAVYIADKKIKTLIISIFVLLLDTINGILSITSLVLYLKFGIALEIDQGYHYCNGIHLGNWIWGFDLQNPPVNGYWQLDNSAVMKFKTCDEANSKIYHPVIILAAMYPALTITIIFCYIFCTCLKAILTYPLAILRYRADIRMVYPVPNILNLYDP